MDKLTAPPREDKCKSLNDLERIVIQLSASTTEARLDSIRLERTHVRLLESGGGWGYIEFDNLLYFFDLLPLLVISRKKLRENDKNVTKLAIV